MGNRQTLSLTDLLPLLGSRKAPCILDICVPEDHAEDPRFIPGAMQIGFEDAALADFADADRIVVVCQKGRKLSQGVAALLRARGQNAVFLEGGMQAWAGADLPLWPAAMHPGLGRRCARWVLPLDMTPDDLWAAWMVRRFADHAPVWMFVEREQRDLVCDRFDALDPNTLAQALVGIETLWQRDLVDIRDSIQRSDIARVLHGACKICPRSAQGIDHGLILLDGLWATRSGAQV